MQSFMIWRCYVVLLAGWKSPARGALYFVRIVACLVSVATYVASAFSVVTAGAIAPLFPILTAFGVALLVATTIIIRLVNYRQRGFLVVSPSSAPSEEPAPSSLFDFVISLVAESGGLYALWMVAFAIMLHINSYSVTLEFDDLYYTAVSGALRPAEPWQLYHVVYFCTPAVQVIAAYLALARVASGRAVSKDTIVSPIVMEEESKAEIIFDEYSDAV